VELVLLSENQNKVKWKLRF